jgi:hypothetical protein
VNAIFSLSFQAFLRSICCSCYILSIVVVNLLTAAISYQLALIVFVYFLLRYYYHICMLYCLVPGRYIKHCINLNSLDIDLVTLVTSERGGFGQVQIV